MEELLNKKNVWAVAEGYKESRHPIKKIKNLVKKLRGETCYRYYVTKKEDVPAKDRIPKQYNGKETDVIEYPIPEELGYRDEHRPIKSGISMCNAKSTACTSGIPVYKNGNTYASVNNHCQMKMMAKETVKGDKIIQPSLMDGGTLDDNEVGEVVEWYQRSTDKENELDSGLNLLTEEMVNETIRTKYEPKLGSYKIGEKTWKEGRTTKYTKGVISDINATIKVNSAMGTLLYKGMIIIKGDGFSAGGDSSSWCFIGKNPIAQLFAGNGKITVAQPGQRILDYFKVSLVPQGDEEYYVAIGNWLSFNKKEITTRPFPRRAALRNAPGFENTFIKWLPPTKIQIVGNKLIEKDGYLWIKVCID